jgi:hypothetical protein
MNDKVKQEMADLASTVAPLTSGPSLGMHHPKAELLLKSSMGLESPATTRAIEKHLDGCVACAQVESLLTLHAGKSIERAMIFRALFGVRIPPAAAFFGHPVLAILN